jgi:tetrahydrodipicolinate N-succinyltransferase
MSTARVRLERANSALEQPRRVGVRHRSQAPSVDASTYVAASAELIGRVAVGPRAAVTSGAVLDAGDSRVEIGERAIVCEQRVLRATAVGDEEHPVIVGDHAFVGPQATLLGCEVEAAACVATGATVLHGPASRPGPWSRSERSYTAALCCPAASSWSRG